MASDQKCRARRLRRSRTSAYYTHMSPQGTTFCTLRLFIKRILVMSCVVLYGVAYRKCSAFNYEGLRHDAPTDGTTGCVFRQYCPVALKPSLPEAHAGILGGIQKFTPPQERTVFPHCAIRTTSPHLHTGLAVVAFPCLTDWLRCKFRTFIIPLSSTPVAPDKAGGVCDSHARLQMDIH